MEEKFSLGWLTSTDVHIRTRASVPCYSTDRDRIQSSRGPWHTHTHTNIRRKGKKHTWNFLGKQKHVECFFFVHFYIFFFNIYILCFCVYFDSSHRFRKTREWRENNRGFGRSRTVTHGVSSGPPSLSSNLMYRHVIITTKSSACWWPQTPRPKVFFFSCVIVRNLIKSCRPFFSRHPFRLDIFVYFYRPPSSSPPPT